MTSRPLIAGSFLAVTLTLAGCSSSSSGGEPPAATQPATAPATLPPGAATFDGAFNGILQLNLCTPTHVGSVQATIDGDDSTGYLGSLSASTLNFKGPKGGIFSTKPGTAIKRRGRTFDTNGLVLTDTLVTQKSVTVRGNLTCP